MTLATTAIALGTGLIIALAVRAVVRLRRAKPSCSAAAGSAGLAAQPVAPAPGEIVWCVVGVGPENALRLHRVAAASDNLAAEVAFREVADLRRVVGVSPITI